MLIWAHSGGVLGSERKTDPASSARSSRKGLKDNNNRLLGIVNNLCIPFGTEIMISTLHRVANFRVKHLDSDIEKTRRGIILLIF